MRLLIVSLIILIGAVSVALFAYSDTGHIVIAYGDWSLETSLALAVAAILLTFLALHYLIRLWMGLSAAPQRLRRWRRHRRNAKIDRTYQRGMIALAEGHWQEAEKWLLKHAHHSETPALHYLAAAEAAEEQGSQVRRDSYLRAALAQDAKTELAVGLAQARYRLEHRDPADAVALLSRLYVTSPKHPAVLKRLMEATIAQGDWEKLLDLLPELRRREVITEVQADELRATAYRALFTAAGQRKDAGALQALWERAPRLVKRDEAVLLDYARALAAADPYAGRHLEPLLAESIARRWSDALIYAYGLIASDNLSAQLATAERWLKHHPQNPVLLLTLGRLCVRNQLWGKGRSYLEASIGIDPRPETYRELAALLERLDNKGAALECYRKALSLVPDKYSPDNDAPPPRYKPLTSEDIPLLPAQSS